jgi:hypothetical protein
MSGLFSLSPISILSDYNEGGFPVRKTVLLTSVLLLGGVAGLSHAQENPAFGQSLQTKFQARMTSLNALLHALEKRLQTAKDYQAGVIFCANKNKFYMPPKSTADADGCVGLDVEDISDSQAINVSTGCSHGSWNETLYNIPGDVIEKMSSGIFEGRYGKVGTRQLSIEKGTPSTYEKQKKWDEGWFGEDRCTVRLTYDGGNQLKVACRGDDGAGKCRGTMQTLDWTSSKLILKKRSL